MQAADLTAGPVPGVADDSAVVFVSCVLEYVADPALAAAELRRMAGSLENLFIVFVDPWSLTAIALPGRPVGRRGGRRWRLDETDHDGQKARHRRWPRWAARPGSRFTDPTVNTPTPINTDGVRVKPVTHDTEAGRTSPDGPAKAGNIDRSTRTRPPAPLPADALLMTRSDVAAVLRTTPRQISNMIARGQMPAHQPGSQDSGFAGGEPRSRHGSPPSEELESRKQVPLSLGAAVTEAWRGVRHVKVKSQTEERTPGKATRCGLADIHVAPKGADAPRALQADRPRRGHVEERRRHAGPWRPPARSPPRAARTARSRRERRDGSARRRRSGSTSPRWPSTCPPTSMTWPTNDASPAP
jgi:hypothetical protein